MIKIVVTGPESSGKTTLATALASHYQAPWVPEYARTYLDQLNRPYQEEDLLLIAQGQMRQEEEAARRCPPLLICDTSLVVIKVWSDYRYGRCHPWIEEQLNQRSVDSYLLCRPDLPWEPDPQRENPRTRDVLFTLYQKALSSSAHVTIEGESSQRLKLATHLIDGLFGT